MNKKLSLGDFSKGDLLSKIPKSITPVHLILILVGLILLALTIYFAVSYFGAVNEKNTLNRQITQKQQQINAIGGLQNIGSLESQLESAMQDLIDKSPFPSQINNTEVAYSIIQAAREASIACYQYNPLSPITTAVNNRDYTSYRYSITSQGAADSTGEKIVRIVNFLEALEETYDTASISALSMSDGDADGQWTFGFTYSILSLSTQ